MNEGVLVLDSTGNIMQSNARALEILRLTTHTQNINIFEFLGEFGEAIGCSITSRDESFEISINGYFCHTICMPIFVKNAKSTNATNSINKADFANDTNLTKPKILPNLMPLLFCYLINLCSATFWRCKKNLAQM